jgi:hypothetical protein
MLFWYRGQNPIGIWRPCIGWTLAELGMRSRPIDPSASPNPTKNKLVVQEAGSRRLLSGEYMTKKQTSGVHSSSTLKDENLRHDLGQGVKACALGTFFTTKSISIWPLTCIYLVDGEKVRKFQPLEDYVCTPKTEQSLVVEQKDSNNTALTLPTGENGRKLLKT